MSDDLERARDKRYQRGIKRKTGLDVAHLAELALQAEDNGATPEEVRAILDGDLSGVVPTDKAHLMIRDRALEWNTNGVLSPA